MLLDDIINTAAEAILQCIQAMEPFMQRWADARTANPSAPPSDNDKKKNKGRGGKDKEKEKEDAEWDGLEAVEQGLVAFSTLLESHTDIAFDFFEAWSLRNIFAIPPDLPVVAPHQQGLDLNPRPEEEAELMADIEELRRKIENQRRLKRTYQKALRISRLGRLRSERNLSRVSYLSPSSFTSSTSPPQTDNPQTNPLAALATLPPSLTLLFESIASLPHIDGTLTSPIPPPDPSKRLWETGHTGYVTWAVQQLIAKAKENAPAPTPGGSNAVSNVVDQTERVGEVQDVKALLDNVDAEGEEVAEGDEGNDMDTT
ncbi:uncharacterized protein FOMMEDRAFT_108973, partial [Fomitiporia mediterranea MF3/22]|uniref:uncharacterized protein n=1 Tax=Fomitiporia mediterranea (strain MF3/22) TaxID=694068 RepID=UPI0004408183